MSLSRKDRAGIEYETVVDDPRVLRWGSNVPPPGEVERELKVVGVAVRDFFPEEDPSVGGEPIPIRAKVTATLAINGAASTPWKAWLTSVWPNGSGWLVKSDSGWRFYPQPNK